MRRRFHKPSALRSMTRGLGLAMIFKLASVHADSPALPDLQVPAEVPLQEPAPAIIEEPAAPIPPRLREGQFGIAVHGLGSWVWNDHPVAQYGFGAALLLRVNERLTAELAAQYHLSYLATDVSQQRDIPLFIGLRLALGAPAWLVSPYLAVSIGADYAVKSSSASRIANWYFDSTYGAGIELRLTSHVALTLDLRGNTRVRIDQPIPDVLNPVSRPRDLQGLQLRGGTEIYF